MLVNGSDGSVIVHNHVYDTYDTKMGEFTGCAGL